MNGLDDLDDFIADLERMGQALENPQRFLQAHEGAWLEVARRVGRQTLMALRPEDVEAAAWRDDVENFTDLVFSRSVEGGLEFLYAGRTGQRSEEDRGKVNYTPLTYDDVLEWVKAGPENGGKDVTAVENSRGRHPEQIAYDVHTAIVQHRLGIEKKDYSRITERLEEWVNSRVLAGDMDLLLDAVLEAWYGALVPVVERDFERWVDGIVG